MKLTEIKRKLINSASYHFGYDEEKEVSCQLIRQKREEASQPRPKGKSRAAESRQFRGNAGNSNSTKLNAK